jgi:hypothetical protein
VGGRREEAIEAFGRLSATRAGEKGERWKRRNERKPAGASPPDLI